MIAIAMACTPTILIADEPTTALDVTIQAQILDLMLEMKERTGAAVMLITHDLGVIAETAQRVVVMYAGRKVEEAPVKALFAQPRHPLRAGLMTSIPRLNRAADESARPRRLTEIPGVVPSLIGVAQGCTFAPRCPYASEQCRAAYPPELEAAPGHFVACWNAAYAAGARPVPEAPHASAPVLEVDALVKHYPGARRTVRARGRHGAGGRRRVVRCRARAKRWAWSARAAAGSRRRARRSCAWSSLRAAPSGSKARTSPGSIGPQCGRAAAGCR